MCIKDIEYLVNKGQYVSQLFVLPVVINLHEYRFEVHTLVSEIYDNVDIVVGIRMCMKWKE